MQGIQAWSGECLLQCKNKNKIWLRHQIKKLPTQAGNIMIIYKEYSNCYKYVLYKINS